MAAAAAILELDPPKGRDVAAMVDAIVRLEKKIFPKHESLSKSFHDELRKRNTGLLYLEITRGEKEEEEKEIAGYVMYSSISSLCASITKLAVKENYRGLGHGEALLRAAIQRCRTKKFQRVCLHVDPTRTSAVSLYRKLGFQGLDTMNPMLIIDDHIKLIGECQETVGTRYAFSENDAAPPASYPETRPSESISSKDKEICGSKQGPSKHVNPIASLNKILKFKLASDDRNERATGLTTSIS